MSSPEPCPICEVVLALVDHDGTGGRFVACRRCGEYRIDSRTIHQFSQWQAGRPTLRLVASHFIRRMANNAAAPPLITVEVLADIRDSKRLPTPQQQADNFVLWLGDHLQLPTDVYRTSTYALGATIGTAIDYASIRYIAKHLTDLGLLTFSTKGMEPNYEHLAGLTFPGWERYEVLKRSVVESQTGFMAMKFGIPAVDKMFFECFRPASLVAGFELRRADDPKRPGLIDSQMMVDIRTSAFVIADLTNHSLGAYWEAGYAAGLGKPIIYTCEKSVFESDETHFDVNHHVTIKWELTDPDTAARELKAMVRNALPGLAKMTDD